MQNNAFGGYGAGMAFAGMTQQQRSLMSNALDRERMESPASSGMGCECALCQDVALSTTTRTDVFLEGSLIISITKFTGTKWHCWAREACQGFYLHDLFHGG